jgi:hypothetical protein
VSKKRDEKKKAPNSPKRKKANEFSKNAIEKKMDNELYKEYKEVKGTERDAKDIASPTIA